jgi:hypothetical protein
MYPRLDVLKARRRANGCIASNDMNARKCQNLHQPYSHPPSNQVTPGILLPFNRLKQALEVSRAKPIEVVALDNLNKHRRPVHQMLSEELQQVPTLVKVDENIQTLEHLKVLVELESRFLEPHLHRVVVRFGHLDKLDAASFQVGNVAHDIIRSQRNMLDARAAVKVDVFLNLALLFTLGRLVDGHLDHVVWRAHDDALERRVLGAYVLVVDAPEAVETEHLFVVFARAFHFIPVLVADAVVDCFEFDLRQILLERIGGCGFGTVTGEEDTSVVVLLDECVGCVAVCADGSEAYGAVGVRDVVWCRDGSCA